METEADAIQAEKVAAMRPFRRLRQIGTLLRCLEAAAAALFLVSWSSTRDPAAAARLSADFLRRLGPILLSRLCVFLLCNAIVLLLFAESRRPPPSSDAAFGEFLEIRRGSGSGGAGAGHFTFSLAPSPEEAIYEDKAVFVETPACGRSRSARMARRREAKPKLRRTDTNSVARKGPELAEEDEKEAEAADAEEFRRKVEAFIAKQNRFLREECERTYSAGTPKHSVSLP